MNLHLRLAASAAAILSLSQPALAQSADCVQPGDLADATTYTMPLFVEALQSKCGEALPSDSFIRARGADFAAGFAPLRENAWPGARRVLVHFIESETGASLPEGEQGNQAAGGVMLTLMKMEGDELRPFVDALATQLIAEEIKPGTCSDVDAVLPLLAPLPAENYGMLVSTILGFVAKEDDAIKICAAD